MWWTGPDDGYYFQRPQPCFRLSTKTPNVQVCLLEEAIALGLLCIRAVSDVNMSVMRLLHHLAASGRTDEARALLLR